MTKQTIPVPGVSHVLDQHAAESSFLWGLRSAAVAAPHYSLADLAKLDQRVEAHLDGLRIAGEEGWQLCRKELAWKEPGEVFAAAVLAFEGGNEERMAEVLNVCATEAALARGLISALGWLLFAQMESHAKRFLCADSPSLRRVGIAAFAAHRQNPGDALCDALASGDPFLKARACKAVGELGRLDLLQETISSMASENAEVRSWAAWAASLLSGYASALAVLQSIAESPSPWRERALIVGMRRMEPGAAKAWQNKLAQNTVQLRLAVIGAGAVGDPEFVPWLLDQMKAPPLARAAGEAFAMITGVDIAYQDLEAKRPEGFEAGPTEDPTDENVEMDPDENLPWPAPDLIRDWWAKHQSEFAIGTRYLLGKPITNDWLWQVLRIGRQRQRAAAALELAMLNPGQPLFNVAAPGFRQQQILR